MTLAVVPPLTESSRETKAAALEPRSDSVATPAMLRAVARELKSSPSRDAFADLTTQFEAHARYLDQYEYCPQLAVTHELVTMTERRPIGSVLVVPAPSCVSATIGIHVAAALTAGNQISLATFGEVDGITSLFHEVLTYVMTSRLFAVLSPGTGWEASGGQSIVVVTPHDAFVNDQPWWRQHRASNDARDIGDLMHFYEHSSQIRMPFCTSAYDGSIS